jgi:hypothetical protein
MLTIDIVERIAFFAGPKSFVNTMLTCHEYSSKLGSQQAKQRAFEAFTKHKKDGVLHQ